MTLRRLIPLLALAGSVLLAACGGSDSSSEAATEASTTPGQARVEIGKVRSAIDDALASLKQGDRAAAGEAIAEGYVEHFEKVEGPLEKADPELKEKLEDSISTDLRDKIKSGASRADVEQLATSIRANLDNAERKLK
ncbi:MAG TPA: hypothetical protein VH276_05315 [Solirubrobacteraceae bacterium]|jgi:hypothetical protein|nr:hypothetical protein [Solirubrobacteraceae bacterium]